MQITTIKKKFLLIKKIFDSNFQTSLSIKMKFIQSFKKQQINVYVDRSNVLSSDQDKNISVKHKSLSRRIYLFESIVKKNVFLKQYLTKINALLTNEMKFISMTNFEEIEFKIFKKQLLKQLKSSEIFITQMTIRFNYENVFIEKHITVNKKNKTNNSYVIDAFDDLSGEPDISDH